MSNEMKITVPVAILILIISIIVSFVGYFTNKTLVDINNNIGALGQKIEKLIDVRYDHETRLKLLEDRAVQNSELITKLRINDNK